MNDKINLLIIEDEALIAENLKLTLEDLGYQVDGTYYHYEEARQAIERGGADLILLDINLGSRNEGEDGLALAALIRQQLRPVPFIFVTAYQDKDAILKASQLRPSAYLIKPINAAAVFAAIQLAMDPSPARPATSSAVPPDYFFVKLGQQTHKLLWQQVYCLEASKNYVLLKTVGSRSAYPIRGTLSFVTSQLVPAWLQPRFIRINRSTVINKEYISSFSAQKIVCQHEPFENTRLSLRQLEELTKPD